MVLRQFCVLTKTNAKTSRFDILDSLEVYLCISIKQQNQRIVNKNQQNTMKNDNTLFNIVK